MYIILKLNSDSHAVLFNWLNWTQMSEKTLKNLDSSSKRVFVYQLVAENKQLFIHIMII